MAGPNLLWAVNSTSSDTAPSSYDTVEFMTSGSVTVVGTGSVIRLSYSWTPTGTTDNAARVRFALAGSPISGTPILQEFSDDADKMSGFKMTHYVTGLAAGTHTFTVQWELVTTASSTNTTFNRRFEGVEFESGVTIKVDVSATADYTYTTPIENITSLTGTFTTASGAGHMMVANLNGKPVADATANLRFALDGTAEGPYSAHFSDSTAAEDVAGAGMEWFKSGLSAASHTFSLQGISTLGSPVTGTTYLRTFQVVEFESGAFTLDVDVSSTTEDTTAANDTMTDMTGGMTPDASTSVLLILAQGRHAGNSDRTSRMSIADDGTIVGGIVSNFLDGPNRVPGWAVGFAVTGETAATTWSVNWDAVSGSPTTGTLDRAFQCLDFAAQVAPAATQMPEFEYQDQHMGEVNVVAY